MGGGGRRCAPVLVVLALLAGCAAEVTAVPTQLAPLAQAAPELRLASELPVRLSTGYTRSLPRGSRWRAIGTLTEGTVYQPLNTVFAIEGRNVHEAYIVVKAGALQGFYLPAEERFSALQQPLSLPLDQGAPR